MKVCELYDHVAQLGFEKDMQEYDTHFVLSANRALFQVSALRPETRTIIIQHEPMENMIKNSPFYPQKKTTDIMFSAQGAKSFYFEAIGNGTCAIEQYFDTSDEWIPCMSPITLSSTSYRAYRGFIKNGGQFIDGLVRLRFTGSYLFYIRNVALYEYIYSDNVEDIPPYEPMSKYDISELAEDFMKLCENPLVDDGNHVFLNSSQYDIENESCIFLPYDKPGVYKIEYYRKPSLIVDYGDPAHDETNIDLAEDLCELIPLLIASYVWADDEPDKAEWYLRNYQAQAALVIANSGRVKPVQYRSTYGW